MSVLKTAWAIDLTYPITYVEQSAAGAMDVIGVLIVALALCSDVEGSKSITVPSESPFAHKEM